MTNSPLPPEVLEKAKKIPKHFWNKFLDAKGQLLMTMPLFLKLADYLQDAPAPSLKGFQFYCKYQKYSISSQELILCTNIFATVV